LEHRKLVSQEKEKNYPGGPNVHGCIVMRIKETESVKLFVEIQDIREGRKGQERETGDKQAKTK
jgi:hypothetical protein